MASTGIASYGSTDSETKPPLKRTMPTRFVQLFRARLSAALSFVEPTTNKRLGKCVGVYAFYWSGLVLWTGCFEGCWLLLVVLCPLACVLVG